ncbi:alanine--tRNA ligase [Pseudostreptobacillus hongkongensis]|uniref:alanine--tRNA ligase n=1 Tax=Pseudostreptobacillus hongkongensis TaxID=1162717 RepID=UPI000835A663|nr:alanine--tRNA ligase [Pseudostreptobacillus hongkongensis]
MTGNELRKSFIDFFKTKEHKHFESASLIPDDKTLLLTVAGMVPFKPFFLGEKKAPYKRITTYQKCIRTNDLENVGVTPRHHTFFEMLGNFSFGDYFKKEAIEWSWEYITQILKLDPKRLYVSVYLTDDEAYDIWTKEIGVPEDHMVRLGDDDNWWAAGPIGSCGPCSEIYYDTMNMGENNEEINAKPGDEGNRFLEIWNLVFTEWNRLEDGSLVPLPEKNIDTGAGLERIASVVQNKVNNFETDIFSPITNEIKKVLQLNEDGLSTPVKIVADHLRASTFLIADGVLPSNEGRGYILKKLIRRAYGSGALENKEIFDNSETYLYKIVDTIIDNIKEAYPELEEKREYIKNIIKNEEDKFSRTLKIGTNILFEEIEEARKNNSNKLSSEVSFKLYDTYGFPFEFTKFIAENNNIEVSEDEFNIKLEEQVKRSQDSRNKTSDMIKDEFIDSFYKTHGKTQFLGYDSLKIYSKVLHIKEIENKMYEIIFEETPFYAESGGQVSDRGIITDKKEFTGEIINVVKKSDIFIHYFKLISGNIPNVGDELKLIVDEEFRRDTMKNHTATHLLHKALREVLGTTVEQAGSLVNNKGLRFDFSYYEAITPEQLRLIETKVNDAILANMPVYITYENINDAISKGAMALFSDKYGDIVRVVDISDYSIELCGGTHVKSTGAIGLFKILSEQGKASGVRRIEAITGKESLAYLYKLENTIDDISSKFKTSSGNVIEAINKSREEAKLQEQLIKELQRRLVTYEMSDLVNEAVEINGVKVLYKDFENKDIDELKSLIDIAKQKLKSCVVIFGSNNDKAIFVAGVTKDLTSKYHSGNIVKVAANFAGGNGGGRPDFAQAGGKEGKLTKDAINAAIEYIKGL